jgi:serine/threonine-protein phosphatase 2A regulatory subunit A
MSTLSVSPTPSLTMARSLPQGVDELGAMGPFELFRSQLEDGSTEAKVDAMKRLAIVAFAMGSDATSSTLIPYLQSNIAMRQPPHEDELLLILAQQLQLLVPGLLNDPNKVLQLLPIVERLSSMEETVVRDEAVKCCNHACGYMNDKAQLVSMATRLCSADWFTAKVSAAGMMSKIYDATQDDELRYLYRDLCTDETPMVRRAAAKHLGKFLKSLNDLTKVQALQPILEGLCKDEQDAVRLLAVASLSDIGTAYPSEWCIAVLLPLVKNGSTDLSW